MAMKKPLSRRHFLKGAGVMIGLPFLEAMLPSLAWAATGVPRLVAMYGGVPTLLGGGKYPVPTGLWGATPFHPIVTPLLSVKDHVGMAAKLSYPSYFNPTYTDSQGQLQNYKVVSDVDFPIFENGFQAPIGAVMSQQHYTVPAPFLGGKTSIPGVMMNRCTTIDQVFNDLAGGGRKVLVACTQAAGYGYGFKGVSTRWNSAINKTDEETPVTSPLALFDKVFSSGTTTAPSAQVLKKKSVLDLVLADANRLSASLGAADKARLDLHFEQIREIERSLSSTAVGGACPNLPVRPGADPAIVSGTSFGGMSDEQLRAQQMADIITKALACDLHRAVSWQVTYDQVGLRSSAVPSGYSGVYAVKGANYEVDMHALSHDSINNAAASQAAMEAHIRWHLSVFARLVSNLVAEPDGAGKLIDNTFVGFGTGEGANQHDRSNCAIFYAGVPSKIKVGETMNLLGQHPGKMWISALHALGVIANKDTYKFGHLIGALNPIVK